MQENGKINVSFHMNTPLSEIFEESVYVKQKTLFVLSVFCLG